HHRDGREEEARGALGEGAMNTLRTKKSLRFMQARIGFLALLIVAGAGAVLHKAYLLQVRDALDLRKEAEKQYLKEINLAPKRGTIYDRNGAELAVSVDMDSVHANPLRMRALGVDLAAAAQKLSELLGVDRTLIKERLESERHFVWIKRRVSPAE